MSINLLFIDDDREFHDLFKSLFERKMPRDRYRLFTAYNAPDALNIMRTNHSIEIILCDIYMPGMDGFSFIEEVKKMDPMIKVIMVSANEEIGDIRKMLKNEVHDFIKKPIDFDDLELTLSRTTEYIRSERDSERMHDESIQLVKNNLEQTIKLVSSIGEMRDPYTAGHQSRVAELAKEIAIALNFNDEDANWIYVSGLLHDIGKICIPTEILSRPGGVTRHEMDLIQDHAKAGYEILKQISFPWQVAEVVYQHHERIDGSGYPRGLKDNEILLEAKILAVADTCESVYSFRPYRPGLGLDKAFEVLQRERGILFDPMIVDICLSLFTKKGFKFKSNVTFSNESLKELRAELARK